ncbi:hypothetical protein [Streptomyces sp. NPDC047999]|uniref:hypothetical protein n=1 Tax=Streptomyces sp. NPDC047999 TaxID=3365497 RepID=UPI003715A5D5
MPVCLAAARLLAPTVCAALLLAGCASSSSSSSAPPPRPLAGPPGAPASPAPAPASPAPVSPAPVSPSPAPRGLPGVGPETGAALTDGTLQALVVTGATRDTHTAEAVLYERAHADAPWTRVLGPWPAHNALRGWTPDHTEGDLRTPIGVFGLGDAGGLLPDPGTLLPYDQDEDFGISGEGFLGEPLEGSFDYVVAIDYNRVPGTTPLDAERPLGEERGGGVWIHVDHQGPTQACISLALDHMRELLRALDPAGLPVIVMGPEADLRR